MTINQAKELLVYIDEKRKTNWKDGDIVYAMANDFDVVTRKDKSDMERITQRIDAQDKVIKALSKTVGALHEYNTVRDGQRG